jgi:hypothetical protein
MKNPYRETRPTLMIRITIGAMFLAMTNSACAATYYVATTGSDSNSGTQTSPFATLQKAANIVNPGDTVIVRDGVYTTPNTQFIDMRRAGKANSWITFKSENRLGAKLNGQNNYTLYMLLFESGNGGYVRVQDFDVYGFRNIGIVTTRSHDLEIIGNDIHDIGRICDDGPLGHVGVYGNSSPNVTITGNTFHDIGRFGPGENGCSPQTSSWQNHDHGIYLDGMNNAQVVSNSFYNLNRGWGIQIYSDNNLTLTNLLLTNNIFCGANPSRDGQIVLAGSLLNSTIDGNLFYEPRNYGVNFAVGDGYTYSNVMVANNTTYGAPIGPTPPPTGISLINNSSH